MTEIYVKLLNRGLKSHEHDKFSFETKEGATVGDLIEELNGAFEERFSVYLKEKGSTELRRDAIVFVNGRNMVSRQGKKTKLSKGDLIVFMIAAVGG